MTYYNDLNTSGVTIDGVPDSPTAGPIQWQMVTGAQGTVVMAGQTATDIPNFTYTSYYLDHSIPSGMAEMQCTGDAAAFGSSGSYVNHSIPCTDPGHPTGCPTNNYLNTTATLYYEPPSQTVATAQALNARANAPLTFRVQAWVMSVGGVAQEPVVPGVVSAAQEQSVSNAEVVAASMALSALVMASLGFLLMGRRRSN